jgi:glycosyltransferase involved in cell wall biosynthesis
MMRVWVVSVGEPVPLGADCCDRLFLAGSFSRFLAALGHEVIWWTSAFDHFRKKQWVEQDTRLSLEERLDIWLLWGGGYRANVSLARLRDHRQIARAFAARAWQEPRPDVILAVFPPIRLCLEAVTYGRNAGIPVVVAVRDLWPDAWLDLAPRVLRPAARMLVAPLARKAQSCFAGATAIVGLTEPFLNWAMQRGRRERSPLDRVFPLAYARTAVATEELQQARDFWERMGIRRGNGRFVICFFGSFGRHYDIRTVLAAARILQNDASRVLFVLGGAGERLEKCRSMAADLDNVVFPGWLDDREIRALMHIASVGLVPYRENMNFVLGFGNKPAEYLSAGLPIGLSLDHGTLRDLLQSRGCGFSYGGDASDLAHALRDLDAHPDRWKTLSENARAVFRDTFAAEKVYGEMTAYLAEIAASQSTNRQ